MIGIHGTREDGDRRIVTVCLHQDASGACQCRNAPSEHVQHFWERKVCTLEEAERQSLLHSAEAAARTASSAASDARQRALTAKFLAEEAAAALATAEEAEKEAVAAFAARDLALNNKMRRPARKSS